MEGRHVIVTGGSRGIGLAMVQGLLADGFCVSTCSRNSSSALRELQSHSQYSSRLFFNHCSIGENDQIELFVKNAIDTMGPIYALINNAGIAQAGILASFPNTETEKILKVNLFGAIQAARAARHPRSSRPESHSGSHRVAPSGSQARTAGAGRLVGPVLAPDGR